MNLKPDSIVEYFNGKKGHNIIIIIIIMHTHVGVGATDNANLGAWLTTAHSVR